MIFLVLLFMTKDFYARTNTGTTVANFLEIGMGSRVTAMGNAGAAISKDLFSMYWNPAGLSFVNYNTFSVMNLPWVSDININYISLGVPVQNVGTFGISITSLSMNDMNVTTLEYQEGTGQTFTSSDINFSLGFGRNITDWFAFGFTTNYIYEKIYMMSASAFSVNLGVHINTYFFSPTGDRKDGMEIGMSISNFGTKMQLSGLNTLIPADINPNEDGNNDRIKSFLGTDPWPLPLYYRVGFVLHPIVSEKHKLNFACDAVHPNNNTEFINLGTEYIFSPNRFFDLALRAGYASLFKKNSEEGLTFGAGLKFSYGKLSFSFDYSYNNLNRLRYVHRYTFNIFM